MTRARLCAILTAYGHSAAMALRIAIDYERGDTLAREWVKVVETSR